MTPISDAVAAAMYAVLPGWVRLPSLTLELPHLVYWGGLIVFPLIAMRLLAHERRVGPPPPVSLAISYLLWFAGGFVGLHRFYLRAAAIGYLQVALFVLVLYGNRRVAAARNQLSEVANALKNADFEVEHFGRLVRAGREAAAANLAAAERALVAAKSEIVEATAALGNWEAFVGGFAFLIAILMLIDAVRLPSLWRAYLARLPAERIAEPQPVTVVGTDPRNLSLIDRLSGWSGELVAYWSLLAVFVYYYEVIARYVFNSPTNWAHESMYLMFGMQYLLSGAFALREGAHVRVDVIFERLGPKVRIATDIATSVFFFIFCAVLLVTGTIFALDSIEVWEVSFSEWAIQYWPVKVCLALGALLILLQGAAKLCRDIRALSGRAA